MEIHQKKKKIDLKEQKEQKEKEKVHLFKKRVVKIYKKRGQNHSAVEQHPHHILVQETQTFQRFPERLL